MMKTNLLIICIAISFLLDPTSLLAQPANESTTGSGYQSNSLAYFGRNKKQRELDELIREEAINFRQAADQGSRDRAEEKLIDLLSKDYDERLKGYQENLDRLEKELNEMRRKLQKRREAKDEMIRLRIKVLEAEADDLGWPERPRRSSFDRNVFGAARTRSLYNSSKAGVPKSGTTSSSGQSSGEN